MGVRGPKSKNRRTTFCRVPHGELTAKKWLDSIEKQKRISNLNDHDRQTERHPNRQTESIVDYNRLLG